MTGRIAIAAALACLGGAAQAQVADLRAHDALRVCADPAAVPMSSQDGTGFENRIAELIAEKLGVPVAYTWFPQGPGFIRKTLRAGLCDVVIGYAQGDEMVQNTNHYYTSAYGIVTRRDSPLAGVDLLEDPALKGHPIGVVAGTPPATNMARAGLAKDMRGWDLFVDRRVENPVGDMLAQVKSGDLAAAVIWGPLAGPLVKADPELQFTPLDREPDTQRAARPAPLPTPASRRPRPASPPTRTISTTSAASPRSSSMPRPTKPISPTAI